MKGIKIHKWIIWIVIFCGSGAFAFLFTSFVSFVVWLCDKANNDLHSSLLCFVIGLVLFILFPLLWGFYEIVKYVEEKK